MRGSLFALGCLSDDTTALVNRADSTDSTDSTDADRGRGRGGWRGDGWRGDGWRGDGWRGHGWRGNGWHGDVSDEPASLVSRADSTDADHRRGGRGRGRGDGRGRGRDGCHHWDSRRDICLDVVINVDKVDATT